MPAHRKRVRKCSARVLTARGTPYDHGNGIKSAHRTGAQERSRGWKVLTARGNALTGTGAPSRRPSL